MDPETTPMEPHQGEHPDNNYQPTAVAPSSQEDASASSPPTMSPQDMAALARNLVPFLQAAAPQAPAPTAPTTVDPATMSPEQRAEYFKTFNIDDDFARSFVTSLRPDESGNVNPTAVAKALGQLRDGLVAQAGRLSELMMERLEQQFGQRLAPIQTHYANAQRDAVWNEFTGAYPELKPFRELVDAKAVTLKNMGVPITSKEDFFRFVAEAVANDLKQVNANFRLGTAKQTQAAPAVSMTGTAMHGSQTHTSPATAPANANPFFDAELFGKR